MYAEVERLVILGTEVRMAPLALQQYAEKYLEAARQLPESVNDFDPVRLYLVCHSIELALKSFLSLQGKLMTDMASLYGHNLQTIFENAEHEGIRKFVRVNETESNEIIRASEYYNGKVFEYPAIGEAILGFRSKPSLPILLGCADILVSSLKQPFLEA